MVRLKFNGEIALVRRFLVSFMTMTVLAGCAVEPGQSLFETLGEQNAQAVDNSATAQARAQNGAPEDVLLTPQAREKEVRRLQSLANSR